jgi:heme oxygenase (biliverdin-IX-beta and delta-forming)
MDVMMILPRLRAECAAVHQALEEHLDVERWLSSSFAYRQLLEGFWGIYSGIEPRLERAMEGFLLPMRWEERWKLPLLKADLRALGASDDEIAELPVCGECPEIDSRNRALGVLYVLEGSTLGGQVISKMIFKRLGLGAEDGAAFFNGYGSDTGTKWKQFGEALTAAVVSADDQEEVVAAAKETFGCFEEWLCGERMKCDG